MNWIKTVSKADISSISLDSDSNELTVVFDVTVGERGEVAEYTEVLDMDETTPRLRAAASEFTEALVQTLRAVAESTEDVKCLTCTGSCCYSFDSIRVTRADVERMVAGGLVIENHVDLYDGIDEGHEDWSGNVGRMKERVVSPQISKKANVAGQTGCVNLTPQGCSIYEHRPTVCREFSPYTCDETYEEDQRKVQQRKNGKMTLRVVSAS